MATYLGNGQYNLLDVMRKSKDPSINYDGLYEDPSRDQGSYTSNPFKAMTSSDYQYLNPKSLKSRNNSDQYNIFSPYDVPVNQRMRLDNMAWHKDRPLPRSYSGPQGSQFDNFGPRIGKTEVVSDFVAGDDGPYLGGNYPDNPYPGNTELGDMTGLVTDQFYDQIDKAPTITDMIENNQYDVNDTALGIMENAFNQRQIMADETSAGNYPIEQISPTIDYSNVMGRDLEADDEAQIVNGLKQPYTMRGQFKNDLKDIADLPGRIKDGIIGSAPVEFMGEQFNKAKDGIMGSKAMNFFRSLPTPTNMLLNMAATRNPLNPRASNYNPTLQGQVDFMKSPEGFGYGKNPNSGLGQITGGRLAGKHLVSAFGLNDLGKMYSKDLSRLQGYKSTMPQRFSRLRKATLGSNLPGSYQDKMNNLDAKIAQNKREAEQAQIARQAATANRARAANASVYANADAGNFTRGGGGFASHNTGTNPGFSNRTGRGRTGYQEGGLASMFTRRR